MDGVLSAVSAIFWGLILLSVLVFIHEGGHFIAARALGIRVTEFFLGLPCRWRLSHTSRTRGTSYGVTPLLLGGYTLVCGMDGQMTDLLAPALALVQERGRVSVSDAACALGCSTDEVLEAFATLTDWASIEGYYDPALGEHPGQSDYPQAFQTRERDGQGLTRFDRGNDFDAPGATAAGEPHPLPGSPDEALDRERSHTYVGHGFWGRCLVLVSGVAINILCGFLLVVAVLSLAGIPMVSDEPLVGAVEQGSAAEAAGLVAGDRIISVAGVPVEGWGDLVERIQDQAQAPDGFQITYEHDGQDHTADVPTLDGETLGIQAATETVRLPVDKAFQVSGRYVATTASYIAQLLQPAHVGEIVSNSSSVVGISVMAGEAASQGFSSLALLAAAVSLSLGFMNLLPIPPLDGGKVLIELIQVIIRRPLSLKVQAAISYVGIALFVLLFFVLLRQDIIRFVLGG